MGYQWDSYYKWIRSIFFVGSFLLTFGAGSNGPFLYVYGDDDASGKEYGH